MKGFTILQKDSDTYHDFVTSMRDEFAQVETPDKVAYNDSGLDYERLDEMMEELS